MTKPGARSSSPDDLDTSSAFSAHAVQFYDDDNFLCEVIADFVAEGLANGDPVIVIPTSERAEALKAELTERGVDIGRALEEDRFRLLDAQETLAEFMRGPMLVEEQCRQVLDRIINGVEPVAAEGRPVRVFGEMVDVLWRSGNPVAAIRLESIWNAALHRVPVSLLCAYAMDNFNRSVHEKAFDELCSQHTRVLPTETYLRGDDDARAREVSRLQQRARALEAEIDQRREVEQALRSALNQRERVERELRRSEQELRDFLENTGEGLHWASPEGTILWANRAELQMLGYTSDEYIGRNIRELHEDPAVIDEICERLHRGEQLYEHESRMRCSDGSFRDVLINADVLWRDGRFVHTRCFTRDITARKQAERALRLARDDAERANRAKSDFLAIMSHELRTPLNAIFGYEDLLSQNVAGPITPQQGLYLERIRNSADQLHRLIDQVLHLARIEAGIEEVLTEKIDLYEVARETAESVEPGAAKKGLLLVLDAPASAVIVHTDPGKLRQILLNLLSNALKFTADGEIRLSMRKYQTGVEIDVSDTGIGIVADESEKIFEPFVQADGSSTRQYGGTGLGLSVSRNLARLLGGDIVVASTPGEGSTFTLSLPLQPPLDRSTRS